MTACNSDFCRMDWNIQEESRGCITPYRTVNPSERPLIQQDGDLERLLAEREPLYREFAAHVVDGSGTPGEVAEAIIEELRWSV